MKQYYFSRTLFFLALFISVSCSDPDFDEQYITDIEWVSLNDAMLIDPYREIPGYLFTLTDKNIIRIPSAETSLHTNADLVKYPVSFHKLIYHTSYKGQTIEASGLIIIPIDTTTTHSILSYQHGSIFAEKDIPSNAEDSLHKLSTFHILPAIALAASGYITFVPDLIGHGASSSYLYTDHIYQPSADAVTDMLVAGREFLQENDIAYHQSNLFLLGYSEGGYVTMAAQKAIEENPALGFTIRASAIGGASFNLGLGIPEIINSRMITFPNVFCRRVASWNEYYWHRPLTDFFNQPYAENMDWIFDGDLDFEETNQYLTEDAFALLNLVFMERFDEGLETEILATVDLNSVNHWKPQSPTRIYKGTQDNFDTSQDEYDVFIYEYGADPSVIKLVPIENKNHLSAAYPFIEMAVEWFQPVSKL